MKKVPVKKFSFKVNDIVEISDNGSVNDIERNTFIYIYKMTSSKEGQDTVILFKLIPTTATVNFFDSQTIEKKMYIHVSELFRIGTFTTRILSRKDPLYLFLLLQINQLN